MSKTPQPPPPKQAMAGTAVDQCLIPGFWKPVAVPSHPVSARVLVEAFNFCARGGFFFQLLGTFATLAVVYGVAKVVGAIWGEMDWLRTELWRILENPWVLLRWLCFFAPVLLFFWILSKVGLTHVVTGALSFVFGPIIRFFVQVVFATFLESTRAILGITFGGSQAPQTILEGPWDPPTSARIKGDRWNFRGIAPIEDLDVLAKAKEGFRLGRYLEIRNGVAQPTTPLVLPFDLATHIMVAAPSGVGKTRSVALPFTVSALENDWSVVLFDVKGDMHHDLGGYPEYVSRRDGRPCRLRLWGPDVPLEFNSCYNPLESIDPARRPESLEAAIAAIMGAPPPGGAKDNSAFWDEQYRSNLRNMIRVAKDPSRLGDLACPYDLYQMAMDRPYFEFLARGTSHAADLRSLFEKPDDRYGEYMAGVRGAVQVFGSEVVRERTTFSDFSMEDLDRERTLLLVSVPLAYKAMTSTLLGLFFNALDAYGAARLRDKRFKRKIMVVCDEAPELIKKIDLKSFTAVYRSAGMVAVVIAQDPSMLGEESVWKAIEGNCNVYVLLRGAMEKAAQVAHHRLGQMVSVKEELGIQQQQGQFWGGRNVLNREEKGAVVEVRELRNPPSDFGMWTICEKISPKPVLTDTWNEFAPLPVPGMEPAKQAPVSEKTEEQLLEPA